MTHAYTMTYTTYQYFSVAYGSDAYGAGAYQEVGGTSTGPLANTGYDVIIPIAVGASILIASVILLVKKLRTKKAS